MNRLNLMNLILIASEMLAIITTQTLWLTQLKQINLTVILEVAFQKMEYIQLNRFT
ncbi:hypothetical protein Goarm_004458 [Gossypium armourianum]|uniref:Uncharacterized protein n=1 Tax=Gossypium armourianum TaxID=34283 RepID=A0A7J9JWY0_9ROSI|nr:hypothetical protein [Gossypium armourianum]